MGVSILKLYQTTYIFTSRVVRARLCPSEMALQFSLLVGRPQGAHDEHKDAREPNWKWERALLLG